MALVENGGLWQTWIIVDVDYSRRGLQWTWIIVDVDYSGCGLQQTWLRKLT